LYFENIGLHGNEGTSLNKKASVQLDLLESCKDYEWLQGRETREHFFSGLKRDHTHTVKSPQGHDICSNGITTTQDVI